MTLTFTFRDGTTTDDVVEWAKKFEEREYRQVALTTIDLNVHVSTIWMGMPIVPGIQPCIYETLVVGGQHGGMLFRWENEKDALAGHEQVVSMLTGKDPQP